MKELVLDAEDVMYSHGVNLYEGKSLSELEKAILDDSWDEVPPVYVVQSEDFPDKYFIYNGNHRLHMAKMFRKPLSAVLIEDEEDLEEVPKKEVAYWTRTPWEGIYKKGKGPTADTEYGLIILKIVDSAKYCPSILLKRPTKITWRSSDERRLEEILAESD